MVRINLSLELSQIELVVAALQAQQTAEAVQIAEEITTVRRQHKRMFGIATQTHLRKDLLFEAAAQV